jgi:murein L,D-transpeptidase YafK
MKISYPNSFDQQVAQNENRSNLGGDIFIHGNSVTIGCIPIGNKNIEELFILAHKTGKNNIDVIITPVDFRKNDNTFKKNDPKWLIQKYKRIKNALIKYKS